MLLGKRQRNPIRRTTSMTGITVDVEPPKSSDPVDDPFAKGDPEAAPVLKPNLIVGQHGYDHPNLIVAQHGYDQSVLAMVSPRNYRRSTSGDFLQDTAHFLKSCGLCKRRLAPGRDIYMYRGDTAFCSLECRAQQMKQDDRKDKCSVNLPSKSKKQERHATAPMAASEASSKTDNVNAG